MKAILFFILFTCTTAGYSQTKKQMKTNEKDSMGRVERFDFEYAEKIKKETGWPIVECDGWYILLFSGGWPAIVEYAPADDNVYYILKNFYPNGIIHKRGKKIRNVKFGLWEHFSCHRGLVEMFDNIYLIDVSLMNYNQSPMPVKMDWHPLSELLDPVGKS